MVNAADGFWDWTLSNSLFCYYLIKSTLAADITYCTFNCIKMSGWFICPSTTKSFTMKQRPQSFSLHSFHLCFVECKQRQQDSVDNMVDIFTLKVRLVGKSVHQFSLCFSTEPHWCKTQRPALCGFWTQPTRPVQRLNPGCCGGDMSLQRSGRRLVSSCSDKSKVPSPKLTKTVVSFYAEPPLQAN